MEYREGLYYFNARWYDAELARFTTEDPARDDINWYVYCVNNPMKYTDPTGLDRKSGMTSDIGPGNDAMDIAHFEAISDSNPENLSESDQKEYYDLVSSERFKSLGEEKQQELAQLAIDTNYEQPVWSLTLTPEEYQSSSYYKETNFVQQAATGVVEIAVGAFIWTGVVKAIQVLELKGVPITYAEGAANFLGVSIAGGLIADGTAQVATAFMGEKQRSLLVIAMAAILIDPMVDVGNGLDEMRKTK